MVQGVLQRLSGYLILSEPQSQGCGFFVPAFYRSFDEPLLWSELDLPLYFQTPVITLPITGPLPQIFPW
ncbi:hypothetical protein, partial [Klebsiella pneumoniae]|uniref:hypothetical protein n=1 Tax=Klebsiella pneumoniae TaxID=573 RepID=UPI001C3E0775